jgi:hypothetical protein
MPVSAFFTFKKYTLSSLHGLVNREANIRDGEKLHFVFSMYPFKRYKLTSLHGLANCEANIRDRGKTVHVVFQYLARSPAVCRWWDQVSLLHPSPLMQWLEFQRITAKQTQVHLRFS